MQAVEMELKTFASIYEGKKRLIATHGNRFVLHVAFRTELDPGVNDLDSVCGKVPKAVETILKKLIDATIKL